MNLSADIARAVDKALTALACEGFPDDPSVSAEEVAGFLCRDDATLRGMKEEFGGAQVLPEVAACIRRSRKSDMLLSMGA